MLNERGYSAVDLLWLGGAVVLPWVAVSVVTGLLSWRLSRATGATRGALQPMTTLLRYGLLTLGLVVVLQAAGLNLSSLALLASVLGVGIGFGLQTIANTFVSGVLMALERPVKPGDFVRLGDLAGVVERIGGRSTLIRTLDRVSIIVPNSKMLETELVNWSHGDPLVRLHVPVGVAYGSDLAAVRAALLDAARVHPAVLPEPRPEVRLIGFGDNALHVELLVWSDDPAGQELLKSDLNYQIAHNLRAAGIEIPFPQRTLHVPAAELDAIAARRRGADGVAIADRRHRFSVYRHCFVGAEAVDWLTRPGDLSRHDAVQLGQRLVERGLVHHVLDEHPFRDGAFFYRFYADERG